MLLWGRWWVGDFMGGGGGGVLRFFKLSEWGWGRGVRRCVCVCVLGGGGGYLVLRMHKRCTMYV